MAVTIMDGGMGAELMRRGGASPLWSARALLDAPELVRAVHDDFINAGARVIITNTYSTIPSYLGKEGLEARWMELADLAGRIAREAADAPGEPVTVLGSLPPLNESYRHDLVPPDAEAVPAYEALAQTLAPYVDGFVAENHVVCARSA